MGMSTHIKAFASNDSTEYQKHKKILLLCIESEVSLPKETAIFFDCTDGYLNEDLLEKSLEIELVRGKHYFEYSEDMEQGYEVDLSKLPKNVTKLRFYNSY